VSLADDEDPNGALLARVQHLVGAIPRPDRPRFALLLSPETGARLVTRGELAAHLASAGLERESRDAHRVARKDPDTILMWIETGDSADNALVGFRTLSLRRGRA
jgi:hypothetical protein